jgi:regulator of cell morphogenesis and NO signaling
MITANTKVAEIAAESLAAIRVFQKHGIDFCCGGQRPLSDVCAGKGITEDALIRELTEAMAGPSADNTDWNTASLRSLMTHIVDKHHAYLKAEFPRIQAWLDKVYSKYADQDPASIGVLPGMYEALRSEIEAHLEKEEVILFPWIARFEASVEGGGTPVPLPFGTFDNPIRVMEHEHENAGGVLRAMRSATNDYTVPEHACRTYRALFEALAELEADLHLHIRLENNILHPRAKAMYADAIATCEVCR